MLIPNEIKVRVRAGWYELDRACDASQEASRWLVDALETATAQERQHRRSFGGSGRFAVSVDCAAKAIVLHHVALKVRKPTGWAEVARYRRDCALAYAIRELIWETLNPQRRDAIKRAAAIEYAGDIAR